MNKKTIFEEYVMAVLFTAMLLIGGINVALRYLLNSSVPYAEDMMIPMFVWLSMMGAPCACAKGANMGLSLFTDMMPPLLQKVCLFFGSATGMVLFGYIFYNGTGMIITQYTMKQTTMIPGFPQWIWSLCFPVGSGFYIFRNVQWTLLKYGEINRINTNPGGGAHG
jgi:TRAP-type C4-dicarboxylate transport system permease small subunit